MNVGTNFFHYSSLLYPTECGGERGKSVTLRVLLLHTIIDDSIETTNDCGLHWSKFSFTPLFYFFPLYRKEKKYSDVCGPFKFSILPAFKYK